MRARFFLYIGYFLGVPDVAGSFKITFVSTLQKYTHSPSPSSLHEPFEALIVASHLKSSTFAFLILLLFFLSHLVFLLGIDTAGFIVVEL